MSAVRLAVDALRARGPLHYVCTTPTNLLGMRHWIEDLHFLMAADFYDGQLANVACPESVTAEAMSSFERMNDAILASARVRRHIDEQGPGGRALFLMFDEPNVAAAERAGLAIDLPSALLRRALDDKLATTRLGEEANVRSVPNVLARVDGYDALRRAAAALGPELVVQLPFGDSGQTTFFIGGEDDYLRHAAAIEAAPAVKVMRRIRCRQAAVEACVTRSGVAVGPLATELVGFPELTPYRGGWCGNEIAPGAFDVAIVDEAIAIVRRIGAALERLGYRGVFGLDFLIDEDAGDLYLGEMNPRITGLTPLTTQAARDADAAPLMLLHWLEWLGIPHAIDVVETTERLRQRNNMRTWSQLIVKETRPDAPPVANAPASGIWRADGPAEASFDIAHVRGASEALVSRTVANGWPRPRGTALARVMTPARVMTADDALDARAHAWIASVHEAFDEPLLRARRGASAT